MEFTEIDLKKVEKNINEIHQIEKLMNIFSYPADMRNACLEWIMDNDDGELFYITANEEIIGITGWYEIDNFMYGLRWHGILPEYRSFGYSNLALRLLLKNIVKCKKTWVSLYEIAPSEKTAGYFLKQKFKRVHNDETRELVIEAGGDIGESIVLEYNATSLDINSLFGIVEQMYDVKIHRLYDGDGGRNYGASGGKDIYLAPFDDPDLEITACFHELGHILTGKEIFHNKNKQFFTCKLSSESLAWEIGFREMANAGFCLHYNSKEYEYARKCLASYIGGEYDDSIKHSKLYEYSLRYKLDKELGVI